MCRQFWSTIHKMIDLRTMYIQSILKSKGIHVIFKKEQKRAKYLKICTKM